MSLNLPRPSPPQRDHTGGEQTVNTQQSETISAVTFGIDSHDELNTTKKASAFADIRTAMDGGGSSASVAVDDVTEHTAARKINREDIRQIFKASTTLGTVTWEQLSRIERMHRQIAEGVNMDFNYCCLLGIASIVAGLGLALDSSTTVISSMLLSPIMGPVVGMSYGFCIWDFKLIKRSMRNETISILVCVVFGVIIGLTCSWTIMAESWPTNEMLSRGTRQTFLCGIPIAFFSGLGVALSVLDDQTSSLVGVAISASLLPPAVNCGMLLIVSAVKENGFTWNFDWRPELGYQEAITDNLNELYPSFIQMGIISLMLTVANVIMVAIGSALMFRAKEVLPVKKKVFWSDLKIARRIFQGRIIDPASQEPLSIDDMLEAYIERDVRSRGSHDETDTVSKRGSGNETVSKHEAVSKHASAGYQVQ